MAAMIPEALASPLFDLREAIPAQNHGDETGGRRPQG